MRNTGQVQPVRHTGQSPPAEQPTRLWEVALWVALWGTLFFILRPIPPEIQAALKLHIEPGWAENITVRIAAAYELPLEASRFWMYLSIALLAFWGPLVITSWLRRDLHLFSGVVLERPAEKWFFLLALGGLFVVLWPVLIPLVARFVLPEFKAGLVGWAVQNGFEPGPAWAAVGLLDIIVLAGILAAAAAALTVAVFHSRLRYWLLVRK